MQLSEAELDKLRHSGVKLDADGRFWHEGAQVLHAGLRAAFWRWLDQNPDGRWVLRLDAQRFVYLEVEDAPYAITSLRLEGPKIFVRLSDDSEEELAYTSLRLSGGFAYATVKAGRRRARLCSAAWGALGERIEELDGRAVLRAPTGVHALDG